MAVLEDSVTAREEVEVTVNCCYDQETRKLEWLWIAEKNY